MVDPACSPHHTRPPSERESSRSTWRGMTQEASALTVRHDELWDEVHVVVSILAQRVKEGLGGLLSAIELLEQVLQSGQGEGDQFIHAHNN